MRETVERINSAILTNKNKNGKRSYYKRQPPGASTLYHFEFRFEDRQTDGQSYLYKQISSPSLKKLTTLTSTQWALCIADNPIQI